MKSAIICYNCKTLTRFTNSYIMRVRNYFDTSITQTADGIKVRVCKKCAKKAGYKVQSSKRVKKLARKEVKNEQSTTQI